MNTDLGMQELLEIERKNELDLNDLGPKDDSQLYINKIKHCDRKTRFTTFLALFQFLEPKANRMTLCCGGKTSKQKIILLDKPGRKRKLALIDVFFCSVDAPLSWIAS